MGTTTHDSDEPRHAPTGGARFAYALLAVTLASFAGGIFLAVAWPVASGAGLCRTDTSGLCGPVAGWGLWVVGHWLALALLSRMFVLGLWWWLVDLTLSALSLQLVIETDNLALLVGLLVAPVVGLFLGDDIEPAASLPVRRPLVRRRAGGGRPGGSGRSGVRSGAGDAAAQTGSGHARSPGRGRSSAARAGTRAGSRQTWRRLRPWVLGGAALVVLVEIVIWFVIAVS